MHVGMNYNGHSWFDQMQKQALAFVFRLEGAEWRSQFELQIR